jgi:hypothetical protein
MQKASNIKEWVPGVKEAKVTRKAYGQGGVENGDNAQRGIS